MIAVESARESARQRELLLGEVLRVLGVVEHDAVGRDRDANFGTGSLDRGLRDVVRPLADVVPLGRGLLRELSVAARVALVPSPGASRGVR